MGTRRKAGKKTLASARTSYGVQNGTKLFIADNSGAKIAQIITCDGVGSKGRLSRLPKATVGKLVTVTIKKGRPDLKGNILKAVIIRQKMPFRRIDGTRLSFEDNAAVIVTKEGDPKGSEYSCRIPACQ